MGSSMQHAPKLHIQPVLYLNSDAPHAPKPPQVRGKLADLKLIDAQVWKREADRKARGEGVVSGSHTTA